MSIIIQFEGSEPGEGQQRRLEAAAVCGDIGCSQVHSTPDLYRLREIFYAYTPQPDGTNDRVHDPSIYVVFNCHGVVPKDGRRILGRGDFEACYAGRGCAPVSPAECAAVLRPLLSPYRRRTIYVIFAQCGGLSFAEQCASNLQGLGSNVIVAGLSYLSTSSLAFRGLWMHKELAMFIRTLHQRDTLERERMSAISQHRKPDPFCVIL
eukprot:TRINITY_DN27588_c0_g1_i2.p1 TRINITY_DN27588_c0_g1~~TRINITY_DN27588_c0_g1_i2.p1  ORF type:complete len:208 (+),score=0.73 TRINITY_DN27588_c0_g1_i2:193-816(+)